MTRAKQYKTCGACGESKPVDEFYRRKGTGYLDRWCKPCSKADVARRKSEKRAVERAARLALPPPSEKFCTGCQSVKLISEFYTPPSGKTRSRCDDCRKAYLVEWYAKRDTRARISAYGKQYEIDHPERARRRRLARYGITPEQYDRLYDMQSGKCRICDQPRLRIGEGTQGGATVLCVDHHHGTGAVRGLLCSMCNRALGMLADDPARLRAAITYLQGDPSAPH